MAWRALTATTTIRKAASYNPRRRSLTIQNNGADSIAISQDPTSVDTQGLVMAPGTIVTLVSEEGDEPEADLYVVALSGSPNVRIQESLGAVSHTG